MKALPNPVQITTSDRGPARFDTAGNFLGHTVHDANRTISAGLVTRLTRYAFDRLTATGLAIRTDWVAEVEELDDVYHVTFHSHTGGEFTVQGILTNRGWPCLDHGMTIR